MTQDNLPIDTEVVELLIQIQTLEDEIAELTALSGRHARQAQSRPAFSDQHKAIKGHLDLAASMLNQLTFDVRDYINRPYVDRE